MNEAYDHHRVSREGLAAGRENARLYAKAEASLGDMKDPDERCKTCAFREGTVPNGCAQTQLDVLKCVIEGKPFYCHQQPGQLCHGWVTCHIALAGKIPTGTTAPWSMSPPDSQRHIVDAAEAKRERRAAKRRELAARQASREARGKFVIDMEFTSVQLGDAAGAALLEAHMTGIVVLGMDFASGPDMAVVHNNWYQPEPVDPNPAIEAAEEKR